MLDGGPNSGAQRVNSVRQDLGKTDLLIKCKQACSVYNGEIIEFHGYHMFFVYQADQ